MRELKRISGIINIFIIVLDSRCPISSYNQDFDNLKISALRLFIISKIDLGDEKKFNKIKNFFNISKSKVLFLNLKKNSSRKKILNIIKQIELENKKLFLSLPKIAVIGPPNSGKSTLINLISGNKKIKTGNEAGITRKKQWINLRNEFDLLDTPGILWPKQLDKEVFAKLVIIGAIKKTSFETNEIFYQVFKVICKYYPKKIENLGLVAEENEEIIYNLLFEFAKEKGFLLKNGEINKDGAMNFLIEKIKQMRGITLE